MRSGSTETEPKHCQRHRQKTKVVLEKERKQACEGDLEDQPDRRNDKQRENDKAALRQHKNGLLRLCPACADLGFYAFHTPLRDSPGCKSIVTD